MNVVFATERFDVAHPASRTATARANVFMVTSLNPPRRAHSHKQQLMIIIMDSMASQSNLAALRSVPRVYQVAEAVLLSTDFVGSRGSRLV
jgi:hypothetical protein